ncbi:hypothetical protein H9P43_007959 [Blastocladiella emersonii ATCC 22665]|nr:hypothetical protein H9P43_007959 [Blastocladiella emersonii ATCC 22665]
MTAVPSYDFFGATLLATFEFTDFSDPIDLAFIRSAARSSRAPATTKSTSQADSLDHQALHAAKPPLRTLPDTFLRGDAATLANPLYSHLPADFASTAGPAAVTTLDHISAITALTLADCIVAFYALRHARSTSKVDSGISGIHECDSIVADSDAETLVDACPSYSGKLKSALETDWSDDGDVAVSGSSSTTTTMSDSTCAVTSASALTQSILGHNAKSVIVPKSKNLAQLPTEVQIPAHDIVSRPATPTGIAADVSIARLIASATPTIECKNISSNESTAVFGTEAALPTDLTVPTYGLVSRPTIPTTGPEVDASMTTSKAITDGYETDCDSDFNDSCLFGTFETRGAASIGQLLCSAPFRNGTGMPPAVSADESKKSKKKSAAKMPAAATAYASPASSNKDLAAANYLIGEYDALETAKVVDEMDRDGFVLLRPAADATADERYHCDYRSAPRGRHRLHYYSGVSTLYPLFFCQL